MSPLMYSPQILIYSQWQMSPDFPEVALSSMRVGRNRAAADPEIRRIARSSRKSQDLTLTLAR
ncbi:hypothetical protein N7533_010588 [Penicillium manginii]|uniref:uncharacterized protein n=1 Tax=Penicillium manginii TaxID=203109 RepID=UPI0025479922|nr:uncharacterized protein N7533_010588 [Penicillium manginii]KAJ5743486.1 hypothetical protein N7533_010588 [Penicillium manginii]